jgi:peptide-methionine (R)-S-oxide reductase
MKIDKEKLKEKLSSEEYHVLVEKGTERPFSSEFVELDKEGEYLCKACGNVLFDSENKFDSGCGWPSFWDAKKDSVEFSEDNTLGMKRIEVTCRKCGGHLGHVFDDGPKAHGGKRYCINGVALGFNKKTKT